MDKARIIMEISSDILRVMKAVMNSELGINAKVGVNTLVGSNLEREASVETDGDFIYHCISMIMLPMLIVEERQVRSFHCCSNCCMG